MTSVFALASNGLTWGERASTAGIVTLQGMLTIFLVLSILWAAIEIMHRVVHKEKKVAPMAKIIEEQADEEEDEEDVAPVATGDDGAIVAAITAAISAALADDGYTGAFRVVSFKRASGAKKKL